MGQSTQTQRPSDPQQRRPDMRAIHAAGVATLAAWYYVMYFSKVVHYSTRNDISHLNSTFAFACCGMVVSFFFLAVYLTRRGARGHEGAARPPMSSPACTWVCAMAMSCGTVVHHFIELDYFEQPWCSITSVIEGAAFAFLTLQWARSFQYSNIRPISRSLGMGFAVSAALYVAIISIPVTPAIVVVAMLPLACAGLLDMARRRTQGDREPDRLGSAYEEIDRAYIVKALVAVGLISFANEFERAVFAHISPVVDSPLYGVVFFGSTLLAVGAAYGLNRRFRGWCQADFVSRVSAVIFIVSFVVALIGRESPIVSDFAVNSSSMFATILSLIILAQVTSAYGLSENQSFGFGLGIAILGELAGHFLGSLITSFSDLNDFGLELAAGVGIVLTTIAFLFFANGDVLARLTDCDDDRPVAPRRFGLRCQAVAERYGLSPKETEVMILAAKGRTNERIQKMMGISTGTVNTYFARLYRKLDVHDRQEMLDIIDDER